MKTLFAFKTKTKPFSVALAVLLLILSYNPLHAQTIAHGQNLYFAQGDIGQPAKDFLNSNNVKYVSTINVIGDNYAALNTDKIAADIKSKFPGGSDAGIGVLDWEGKALVILAKRGPVTPEFQGILNDYISILKFAKSLRPNVQWGFYGVPFATYYRRDDSWKQTNINIKPLLKQCDAFFPSSYVPYKDGSIGKDDNEAYAKDNIKEALMLGSTMNKPVLPFVWYRYHESNKTMGLQLIPVGEFRKYVNAILSADYNGTKVAGIVWWGADTYFYNVKRKPLVDEMAASNQPTFAAYHDNLIINYGKEILKAIRKNN